MMEEFTAKQVCSILNITYRQLDYLDRENILSPSVAKAQGTGSIRIYSISDIRQLKVIRELREMGISLQKIRKCIENLKDFFPELEYPLIEKMFLTDSKTVYIMTENPEVNLDILIRKGQLVLFIPIKAWMEELRDIINNFEKQKEEEDKKQADFYQWAENLATHKGIKPMTPEEIVLITKRSNTEEKTLNA